MTIFFFIYLDYDLLINNNRLLSQAICMTGSDLNSSSKPWPIQHRTSKVVYQEFHDQVSWKKVLNDLCNNSFSSHDSMTIQNSVIQSL